MKRYRKVLILVMVLIFGSILACSPTGDGGAKPVVEILSPPSGSRVAAGDEVEVQFRATDEKAVVRVELEVEGEIVDTQTSPSAEGQPSLTGLLRWTPTTPGSYSLMVYAYNSDRVGSTGVGIEIEVTGAAGPVGATPTPEEVTTPSPPPTPTSPPAGGPRLHDIFFASGVAPDGAPQDIAAEFSQGTTIVYAFLSYEGMTDGAECESVWYLDGDEAVRNPFSWNYGASGGPLWIANIKNEDGMVPGQYEWELYVEGQVAARGGFSVVGEPAAEVLFEDDFSDPASGWEVGQYDTGSVGYADGYYYVISSVEKKVMWGVANRSFGDVVVEVDATQFSAPTNNNNSYGVQCGVQSNDDAYHLLISGDGFYSIQKLSGGSFTRLVEWTRSDAINQGNATNQIRAVCDGSRLALYCNGELLAETTDPAYTGGDLALVALTLEPEATEIHFDNLKVYEPAP
jgi:hypothetical protein